MGPACVKSRIGRKSVESFSLLSSRDGSCLHCSISNRRNRDGSSKSKLNFRLFTQSGPAAASRAAKMVGKTSRDWIRSEASAVRRNVELPASVADRVPALVFSEKSGLSTTSPQTHLPSSAPEASLCRPWSRQRPARLALARNWNSLAHCRSASEMASR